MMDDGTVSRLLEKFYPSNVPEVYTKTLKSRFSAYDHRQVFQRMMRTSAQVEAAMDWTQALPQTRCGYDHRVTDFVTPKVEERLESYRVALAGGGRIAFNILDESELTKDLTEDDFVMRNEVSETKATEDDRSSGAKVILTDAEFRRKLRTGDQIYDKICKSFMTGASGNQTSVNTKDAEDTSKISVSIAILDWGDLSKGSCLQGDANLALEERYNLLMRKLFDHFCRWVAIYGTEWLYKEPKYQIMAKFHGFHLFFSPTGNTCIAMRGANPSARVLYGGQLGKEPSEVTTIPPENETDPLPHHMSVKDVIEYTGFELRFGYDDDENAITVCGKDTFKIMLV